MRSWLLNVVVGGGFGTLQTFISPGGGEGGPPLRLFVRGAVKKNTFFISLTENDMFNY